MESVPREYTIHGNWEGLCAAIVLRALLDACGPLKVRHYRYKTNIGHYYLSVGYPVGSFKRAPYLSKCNGNLVKEDLKHFFQSRYALVLVDAAGVNVNPADVWFRLRNNCRYRRDLYKSLNKRAEG